MMMAVLLLAPPLLLMPMPLLLLLLLLWSGMTRRDSLRSLSLHVSKINLSKCNFILFWAKVFGVAQLGGGCVEATPVCAIAAAGD
jgi:hypothetical protein